MVCWGSRGWFANSQGETDAPSSYFTAVSAGLAHSCGLRGSRELECWGWQGNAQQYTPTGRFSAVSLGWQSCGLRESGELVCWVDPYFDDPSKTYAPSGRFSAISVGGSSSCALRETGELECWGENGHGQTDAPPGRFGAVSAGGLHACGLRESGEVECWGYEFDGQAQPPAGKHRAISAGGYHACALSEAGVVTCWMVYRGVLDIPAWLRHPVGRLADGRTELGWLPYGLLLDGV